MTATEFHPLNTNLCEAFYERPNNTHGIQVKANAETD